MNGISSTTAAAADATETTTSITSSTTTAHSGVTGYNDLTHYILLVVLTTRRETKAETNSGL